MLALAELRGDGIEAAARDSRYGFFQNVAERNGARYVATGHTADDQVETVLFNVLRGTGLAGLAGIPRARPLGLAASVIRPLLTVSRAEVIKYLAEIDQSYRIDPAGIDARSLPAIDCETTCCRDCESRSIKMWINRFCA